MSIGEGYDSKQSWRSQHLTRTILNLLCFLQVLKDGLNCAKREPSSPWSHVTGTGLPAPLLPIRARAIQSHRVTGVEHGSEEN